MPESGRPLDFKSFTASSGTQTKMPELPAERRWRHCATSSKFVYIWTVRVTHIGNPVELTKSSFQDHVSGLQLTLVKSFSPSVRHPGAVPSINAFGAFCVSCCTTALEESAASRTTPRRLKFRMEKILIICVLSCGFFRVFRDDCSE